MQTHQAARVLVVDDHAMFGEVMADAITGETDLLIVDSVTDIGAAAAILKDQRVDVVILDLELDGESGMDLLRVWHEKLPETLFILLVASVRRDTVGLALSYGAAAIISKNRPAEDLVAAIRAARVGRVSILVEGSFADAASQEFGLTDRELGILKLLAEGQADNEIAANLHISRNTVRTHVRRLFTKMGVTSRVEAVATARRSGVIES